MAKPFTLKQRLALALIPRIASAAIRCLGVTLRYRDLCEPGATPGDASPPPAIYAFWHRCLLASAWRFRNRGIAILISRSFDGELIARTVERLGFVAVRGSSSREALSGLRHLHRAYLEGRFCAITADGPRGPAMVAKPGAAQLGHLVHTTVGAILIALPTDISIPPNDTGLPGIAALRTIVGAIMTVGLILSVLALIVAAIVWGFGAHSSNPHLAGRGKNGVLVACGAAVLCGGAVTLINFFWNVGQSV